MITLGFPNPCPSNSLMKFVEREAYQKELEVKMLSEAIKFPHDTTPKCILNCIKLLENILNIDV